MANIAPPNKQELREFGLLIGIVFPVALGWLLPALNGHPFRVWTLVIGVPALVLAMLAPRLLTRPYKLWMALGDALGWVNSHIILGAVFLLVLQPIALIMRLMGHDPLRLKAERDAKSYRESRKVHTIDLHRQF